MDSNYGIENIQDLRDGRLKKRFLELQLTEPIKFCEKTFDYIKEEVNICIFTIHPQERTNLGGKLYHSRKDGHVIRVLPVEEINRFRKCLSYS